MIHSRGANASDVEVVWAQLLQGWGGGFAVVATHVSSQASVPHADLALVSAIIILWAEIGGAIGNAIGRYILQFLFPILTICIPAGAIWTNEMPKNLAKNLPQLSQSERDALFGSIQTAASYPRGDAIREGVIACALLNSATAHPLMSIPCSVRQNDERPLYRGGCYRYHTSLLRAHGPGIPPRRPEERRGRN